MVLSWSQIHPIMHTSIIRSIAAGLFLGCAANAMAQFPMDHSHYISLADDQLLVIFTAAFAYGSGSSCPPFEAIVIDDGEQIQLTAIYNTLGPWPDYFCARTDTVILQSGSCSLLIDYKAIVHAGEDEEIVSFGEPEEIILCTPTDIIGRSALSDMKVHPTLFQDRIWIEWDDAYSGIMEVRLLDALGRQVAGPWFMAAGGRSELMLPDLAEGVHLLELRQGDVREVVRVLKE
jgi:hypothetical protein